MQFSLSGIIFLLSFYFTSARTSSNFHPGEEDFVCTLPNGPPPLTAKMKGLLRGLKYISQMFDEKEPEMQIGVPTDVKHVAHIGMDGPSANKPSWMTEFSSAPELSSVPMNDSGSPKVKPSATGNHDSLPPLGNEKPKKSRRKESIGNGSPIGSPRGSSEKQSRRHRSSNLSMESPGRDSPSHPRRNHNLSRGGTESSSQEQTDIPKKSRRKKSKGSSDGSGSGSSRSSRSKGQNSLPDIMELGP